MKILLCGLKIVVAKVLFGPVGNYTSMNSGQRGGLGSADLSYTFEGVFDAGAVLRGGCFASNKHAGVFGAELNVAPNSSYGEIGYRCTYHP